MFDRLLRACLEASHYSSERNVCSALCGHSKGDLLLQGMPVSEITFLCDLINSLRFDFARPFVSQ